jgi:hypothetical protein
MPASVKVEPRIGSGRLFDWHLHLGTMKLGDQELLRTPFEAEGDLILSPMRAEIVMDFAPQQAPELPEGFPMPLNQPTDQAVAQEPGRYTLTTTWDIETRPHVSSLGGLGGSYSWSRGGARGWTWESGRGVGQAHHRTRHAR